MKRRTTEFLNFSVLCFLFNFLPRRQRVVGSRQLSYRRKLDSEVRTISSCTTVPNSFGSRRPASVQVRCYTRHT